eukprot:CCRYP_007405-RA/>CCRYP_007405-RA protein AED:0.46 eAED:0.64 QI:0/0/0/1/0/0/2/0/94
MVNGKQMTVTWHVDDLKASHDEDFELTKLVLFLAKKYEDKITVNQGDLHDYLGMDMDFSRASVNNFIIPSLSCYLCAGKCEGTFKHQLHFSQQE